MDAAALAFGVAVFNVVVVLITAAVSYGRQDAKERDRIAQASREMEEKVDRATHAFGETVAAIREKINSVELAMIRDYVHKDSYHYGMEALAERLVRMEDKIDAARKSQKASGGT